MLCFEFSYLFLLLPALVVAIGDIGEKLHYRHEENLVEIHHRQLADGFDERKP